MNLSLLVAMTRAGVIGRGGGLPWRLSDDLRRFKRLTLGHCVLLGRRTYESLPRPAAGLPLPGRALVVVTRQAGLVVPAGVRVAGDLPQALRLAAGDDEPFLVGGGELYQAGLPLTTRMYVTWVEADVPGDTHFPPVDWSAWRLLESTSHPADDRNEHRTTFCVYQRVPENERIPPEPTS